MGTRREKLPLGKSGHSFQKASSWGVPEKGQQWRQQQVRSFLLSLLPESFLQGPQVLQGLLGLRQLLLKPLAGAFVGGSLQEGLHFLHHCPVARRVVEEPHCPVPTGGQKPASDVKGQVTDTLPVDLLEALLLLTPPRVVEMNTAATGQGQDLGIRGERQAARHGARFFKAACPQQVGVLLLLVFHVCVPQFPRAVLGDRGHPAAWKVRALASHTLDGRALGQHLGTLAGKPIPLLCLLPAEGRKTHPPHSCCREWLEAPG